MSLIPSNYPKPDLFLYERYVNDPNPIDVTNYKIDDLLNLYDENSELHISCLYETSTFGTPITKNINFGVARNIYFNIEFIPDGEIIVNEVSYNNKNYYSYSINLS